MSESDAGFTCGVIIMGILATALLFTVNSCDVTEAHTAAVKAGHAEYYLDANNERQWRWKDNK